VKPALAEPDHLVLGAATLAQGIEHVAELTGIAPHVGGKHVAMGTHNALVRLGQRFYLEIIAIDPDGSKPGRPRWFDLDDPAMQAQLAERPRLIHWAARTHDLDAAGIRPDRTTVRKLNHRSILAGFWFRSTWAEETREQLFDLGVLDLLSGVCRRLFIRNL